MTEKGKFNGKIDHGFLFHAPERMIIHLGFLRTFFLNVRLDRNCVDCNGFLRRRLDFTSVESREKKMKLDLSSFRGGLKENGICTLRTSVTATDMHEKGSAIVIFISNQNKTSIEIEGLVKIVFSNTSSRVRQISLGKGCTVFIPGGFVFRIFPNLRGPVSAVICIRLIQPNRLGIFACN